MDIQFAAITLLQQTKAGKASRFRQTLWSTKETSLTGQRFDTYITMHHPMAEVIKNEKSPNSRLVIEGDDLKDFLFDNHQKIQQAGLHKQRPADMGHESLRQYMNIKNELITQYAQKATTLDLDA